MSSEEEIERMKEEAALENQYQMMRQQCQQLLRVLPYRHAILRARPRLARPAEAANHCALLAEKLHRPSDA